MNTRGFTLAELIVATVIIGIIFLALTCQFVAEQTFRAMINDQIAATNEASIAMRHMTRVLRYAKYSTIITNCSTVYVASIDATINHVAAGDSLPEITDDTTIVTYGRKSDNTFWFEMGTGGTPQLIAKNITAFSTVWVNPYEDGTDGDNRYHVLTIRLTATQGKKSSSLETNIRVLWAQ